jgi:hypothetical protein
MALVALTAAAPLSITYAVLRHRLFDLNFTIRKALQYTLATWVVRSLVPGIATFVILDTIRLREKTVNTVLEQRGGLYLALAAAAVVIYVPPTLVEGNRPPLLPRTTRGVRGAEGRRRTGPPGRQPGSRGPGGRRPHRSGDAPEFAALLVRDSDAAPSAPSRRTVGRCAPDLRDDSTLVAAAPVRGPLDTSTDTVLPLRTVLSTADRDYLTNARIDVLIRVVVPPTTSCTPFSRSGPKRSEEPYAEEDYGILVTIAENLSLLAGHSFPRADTPGLEECPECGRCFDAGTRICNTHDRPLLTTALPRTLAAVIVSTVASPQAARARYTRRSISRSV